MCPLLCCIYICGVHFGCDRQMLRGEKGSCFIFHDISLRTHNPLYVRDVHTENIVGKWIQVDKHLFPCTGLTYTHTEGRHRIQVCLDCILLVCEKPSFYLFTCCATGSWAQSIIKRSYEQSSKTSLLVLLSTFITK